MVATPTTGSKRGRESEAPTELSETGSPSTKLQKQDIATIITITTNNQAATAAPGLQEEQPGCDHILGFRRGRIDYDSVGVLRTKPGRVDSEPTLSMSCSDKIARWNILGLNSALVMPFLRKPMYLESIITRELFDAGALERALFRRIQDCWRTDHIANSCAEKASAACGSTHPHQISVYKSEIEFEFSREAVSKQSEQDNVAFPPVASASSKCQIFVARCLILLINHNAKVIKLKEDPRFYCRFVVDSFRPAGHRGPRQWL
jgi:tRNA-specific adenosine deaminase 1